MAQAIKPSGSVGESKDSAAQERLRAEMWTISSSSRPGNLGDAHRGESPSSAEGGIFELRPVLSGRLQAP